jgi:hypothetical protein
VGASACLHVRKQDVSSPMRLKMLHMKCVQTSVEMLDLMIPELGERDEIENFDSVDTE